MEKYYNAVERIDFQSKVLGQNMRAELFLPKAGPQRQEPVPILFLNDGQDCAALRLAETIEALVKAKEIRPMMVAAVHAGERIRDYGVSKRADYKGRGDRARAYADFVTDEFLPFLDKNYPVDSSMPGNAIAGFSLGGLSAFDIAWNNPGLFSKVGAFSGSFWWRSRAWSPKEPDAHRLAHRIVQKGRHQPGLQFWFQAGAKDETSDRNNNGVIDSIDDTLDLIVELTLKGYRPFHDIHYFEMPDGQHNLGTWGKAMPVFLKWAFPR